MNEVIGYVDTRAAEVATTAIASDVAQVHQDMLDADADASAAAASAAAAAGTLANAVKKTGESSQSIAGDIAVTGTLSGGVVTGTVITAPAPVNNTDAATKKYVDDADALLVPIANINQHAVGLTGNQDPIAGIKRFSENVDTSVVYHAFCLETSDGTKWYKVAEWNQINNNILKFEIIVGKYGGDTASFIEGTVWSNGGAFLFATRGEQYVGAKFKTAVENGKVYLYMNITAGRRGVARFINGWNYYNGNQFSNNLISYGTGTGEAEPTTPTFTTVIDGVVLT